MASSGPSGLHTKNPKSHVLLAKLPSAVHVFFYDSHPVKPRGAFQEVPSDVIMCNLLVPYKAYALWIIKTNNDLMELSIIIVYDNMSDQVSRVRLTIAGHI